MSPRPVADQRSHGTTTTMKKKRRPWGAGLQPGLEIWSPSSPCPASVAGCPGRWGGSGSGAARSPGSGSTSTPSAGPSAGPAARRWLAWCHGTTPSWPRPPGCPHWCETRHAPPGVKVSGGVLYHVIWKFRLQGRVYWQVSSTINQHYRLKWLDKFHAVKVECRRLGLVLL